MLSIEWKSKWFRGPSLWVIGTPRWIEITQRINGWIIGWTQAISWWKCETSIVCRLGHSCQGRGWTLHSQSWRTIASAICTH